LHGANRLGSNSTAECLVWGGITGGEIAKALPSLPAPPPVTDSLARRARGHTDAVLKREGKENLYELRRELRALMDREFGVFRKGEGLARARESVREIRKRTAHAPVADKGLVYNSNLFHALELENLLDLAEVSITGALAREESRGAHARRDFTVRDDEAWLRHTLALPADGGPRLEYKPVTIDTWKPVERKY
jgi:succinate dehydrogenase / fumarate reductase flavoprotein subunit